MLRKLPILSALGLCLLLGSAVADEKISEVNFVVVRDFNGKPVRNASVVLHPVAKDGKQKRSGVQLKTDAEGKTGYPGVPYGKIRVQVIAPNLQTFGEDYEISQPTHDIVIKLKRPQKQHSIYD
jgi:hypothetical protein